MSVTSPLPPQPTILLGKGTYGGVYKTATAGVYKSLPHKTLAHTVREIIAVKGLTHPNVVRGYEVAYDSQNTRIRLKEYTADLYSWSRTPQAQVQLGTLPFIIRVLYGLVSGISHIHSAGLVHADIKPQNILINTSTGDIAYCDFNFCFVSTSDISPPSLIQTPNYRAPEVDVYSDTNDYGRPIDMWSLGAMIYWLVTGHTVLPNDTPEDSTVAFCQWLGYPDDGDRSSRLRRLTGVDLYPVVRRYIRKHLRVIVPGAHITRFVNRVARVVAGCLCADPITRYSHHDVFVGFTKIAKVFYGDKYAVIFRPWNSHQYSGLGEGLPSPYVLGDVSEAVEKWPGCAQNAFGRLCEYALGAARDIPPGSPPVVVDGVIVPVLNNTNVQKACMYVVCSVYMLDLDMLYSQPDQDLSLVVLRVLELCGYNVLHLLI